MNLEYSLNKNILLRERTFNPSLIFDLQNNRYSNKIILNEKCNFILSYRCSYMHWSSVSHTCIKPNNTIEYDAINNKIKIDFSNENNIFGPINESLEDARFTILKDKLHLIYGLCDTKVTQYLSPMDDENKRIELLQGIKLNDWEKNWIVFDKPNSNNIFIIYSFYPNYVVYELDENNILEKIKSCEFPHSIGGRITGGTSPILIDDNLYLFGHYTPRDAPQWAPIYKLSVIVINKDNLNIIGYCCDLLENNNTNNIVYCRGSLYIENLKTFIVSVGIDDIDIKLIPFDFEDINKKLVHI